MLTLAVDLHHGLLATAAKTSPAVGGHWPMGMSLLTLACPLFAGWVLPDGLVYMSLISNHLSGSLPTTWQLPDTLGALFLNNNTLSGTVPVAFWEMLPANMTDINLSLNRLSGTLSADAAIPPALTNLVISNNSLHGECGLGSLDA